MESVQVGNGVTYRGVHGRCLVASTLRRQNQEDEMDQAGIVTLIDEALKRFAGRDLVSSNEVLDLLLDMRTAAVSDAAIAALIDSEAQPAH
jgi:hypothetical protein